MSGLQAGGRFTRDKRRGQTAGWAGFRQVAGVRTGRVDLDPHLAVGALEGEVLLQFLIESATMSLTGGAIGVLMGVGVGKLITLIVGFPTAVPVWSIFLGLFLAGAVGIFFGVYPASKAARLDPVVALRAEL